MQRNPQGDKTLLKKIRDHRTVLCVGGVLLAVFIFFAPSVQAQVPESVTGVGINILLFQARGTLLLVSSVLGKIITWELGLVDFVLRLDAAANPTVVGSMWRITRDFANMFFIVFLIIMAFATIFDVGSFGYGGYDLGTMMGRFLIAALLINFSLVIGQEIIGWTQVLNSTLTTAIGPITNIVLENLQPQELINPTEGTAKCTGENPGLVVTGECLLLKYMTSAQNVPFVGSYIAAAKAAWNAAVTAKAILVDKPEQNLALLFQSFFAIVFLLILIFSLLVPLIFGIIRIPFLWYLLIMSPLAWLTMVLPSTRHISQHWWKQFWGWNLFLPIYLFFLLMGTSLLSNQRDVMAEILRAWSGNSSLSAGAIATKILMPAEIVFFYVVAAMVFIGGAGLAFKSSFMAGTAAAGAAGWARGAVNRFSGATAIGRGAKQRWEGVQKTGVTIAGKQFGGTDKLDKASQAWAQRFGSTTSPKDISAKRSEMDKLTDAEVRKEIDSTNRIEALAAREILLSRGKLTAEEISGTQKMYQEINPLAASAFRQRAQASITAKVESGKFEGDTRAEQATEARSFVAASIAETDPAKRAKEVRDTTDKIAKKDVVLATTMEQQEAQATNTPFDFQTALKSRFSQLTVEETVGQKESTLREVRGYLNGQRLGFTPEREQKILDSEKLTQSKEALLRLIM